MKKIICIILVFLTISSVKAQCTAPSFTVDLSANTDSTWVLHSQVRDGVCCGSSNCVTFTVFTSPGSELISFDVTNPSPSGSAYYQVNCGTPVSIGTPLCIVGLPSPFTITYCKPGGDRPDYIISAGTIVHGSDDISIQKTNCTDTLFVDNVDAASVTWTSIFPGAQGAYNSYLSCTSGCTSTIVTPGSNPPAYVDYQVSGNPNINCGSFSRDTIRVYFVTNLTGVINPINPVICASSGTSVTLTAVASGGAPPYNYDWNPGPSTASMTTNSTGTYTVTIGDKTKCPKINLTATIGTLPSATFNYGTGTYCKNAANPNPTYTGTGQPGVFSASPAGLSFVSTTTGQVNLAASAVGTYTVMNTIAAAGGCPGTTGTSTITIYNYPTMTSTSTASICSGSAVNIPFTSSMSSTYTWVASDNSNVTGESLTTQNTSTLNNTLTNNSVSSQVVIYTVTPTTTAIGGCVGTPQTVSVSVNNMDDAGFSYSASTNCQTGTNPTATITGLAGGIFSSTTGLVFVSSSTGTVNLAASTVGNYTVTYTTNGICPNTATFPINVTTAPSANFSYTSTPYCQDVVNPSPSFGVGASGGTFTSQAGLVFVNNLTGQVDLAASTPGTYTVTNTIAAAGGCAAAVATATITITQLKVATFNYAGTPYCQNGTNPLPTFVGGGVAGVFTAGAGLNINASTGLVNLVASVPGTYTVTNTIAATGGCPAVIATSTITITALPVATFTYPATPYCQNATNPVPIYSGGGSAGVYSASSVFLSINSSTGLINLAASQEGSYTITNSFAAANGCPAVSSTATVTITSLPIAGIVYNGTPFCNNGINPTPILNAGGTNGNYTASPVGLNIDALAGTVNLAASTAGTYTVTNTIPASGGCPIVTGTATLTITSLPIATFNYAGTPYCKNGTNPLPTFTGGGVAGTFASAAGLSITTGTGLVNLASSTSGTYTVTNTIAASAGCPVVSATSTITITTLPIATFSYTGSPYCKNGTNPSPTYSGGGVAGTFTAGAGLSINASTGLINLAASTSGTYTVTNTIAAASGCPAVVSTATVTITTLPIATFNFPATPYCQNGTNPSPVYTGGGVAGAFTSGAGLILNPASGLVNLTASTAGTYTVTNTISAASGCPVVIATSPITITALPIATFSYAGSPYCQNATNPSPLYSGGGVAGIFTSGAGLSINSANGLINLAASTAGTYTVTNTIAAATGCPTVISTATVTITTLPIATFNYASTSYCQNGTNPLPTFIGGGVAGVFSTPAGLSINTNTGLVNLVASTVGTYTVTNTIGASSGCPIVVASNSITINPVATANAGSDAIMCSSTPYTLSGVIGGGASSLTWTTSGTGTFNNATNANAIYTPSLADVTNGTVNLTLTTNDPTGPCVAVNDGLVLTINTNPTASAGVDATICEGTTHAIASTIGGGASSLTWATTGTGSFSNLVSTTPVYTPSAADVTAGTVTLTLTTNDPAGPCVAVSDALILSITPRDIPTFNYGGETYCQSGADPVANITGTTGGTFTASSGALVLNPTTGAIDLSASPLGTYTITYTTAGSCPAAQNENVTITVAPSASFSFGGSPYCTSGTDPLPTFPLGASGGVFTSGGGLVINQFSGLIDLSVSTPGTYTVTNFIAAAGGCATDNATATIQIDEAATVNANIDQVICYGTTVTLAGTTGGSTSSILWTGGAGNYSDATLVGSTYTPNSVDSTAGFVNLTITTDDPAGVCPAVSDDINITISQPAVAIAGVDQTICYGSTVTLSGSIGGSANVGEWSGGTGNFLPNTLDLTGVYVPSAADSALGSITLTVTTDDPTGVCPVVSEDVIITINQPAVANANVDQTICFGNTITLAGTIAGSATSSVWTGGAGNYDNANILGAVYTPTSVDSTAGSITLTLTTNDPAGVCPAISDDVIITISQPAVANANADQIICYGSTVTLVGSIGGSATSSTWTGGAGNYSDVNSLGAIYTPTSVDSTAGSITLTLTTDDPTGVCPAISDDVLITINQPAVANANADQIICYGNTVTLSGTIAGSATSSTWSGGAGTYDDASLIGAIYTPTSIDSTAGTITLTITTNDPAGVCPAISDDVVITINQPAVANANADQTICYGSTVTLAGTIAGSATSSTWTGGAGIYDDATLLGAVYTPTSIDSTAGTITLTITTNDPVGVCPAISDDVVITINQPAVANANADQTICYGSTVTLAGTIAGSATSSTWTGGVGTYDDATLLGAIYTPTSIDSTAGTITLTITTNDPAGVCPAISDDVVITINQPAVANANIDQTICYGDTVILAGTIGGSATSSTWTGGAGIYDDATLLGAIYTPTSIDSTAGTIILTITTDDPAGVCPATSDDVVITINQPAVVNANVDQIICYGNVVNLSGAIGGSATSSIWSGGAGNYSDINSLTSVYAPNAADSTLGTITLTLTTNDPTGVCPSVSDDVLITINQPATVSAGLDAVVCAGSNVSLSGLFGAGASTLTWSTSGTGIFDDVTLVTPIYTPSSADITSGTITLTITTDDPIGPCPLATDQMTLVINSIPTANVGNDTTICAGTNLVLNAQVAGGATSLTWTTSGTGTFNNPSIPNATYTPSAADIAVGTIALTVLTDDPTGPCAAVNDALNVNYTPLDDAGFSYSSSSLCKTTILSNPIITGLAGGIFSASPSTLIINSTTGEVDNNASTLGNYTISYTTSGVCPNTNSVNVSLNALPDISAGADATMACADTSIVLNASSTIVGVSYSWTAISGTVVLGANNAIAVAGSAGVYVVEVTDGNACIAKDTVVINQGAIQAGFSADQISGHAPLNVNFANTSIGATTYAWTFGNGNTSIAVDPSTEYTLGGSFEVTLISSAGICSDTVSLTIFVEDDIVIIIPNVFTPNGDGINDFFFVDSKGVTDLEGDLYNRWGEKIFSFQGINSSWDGKNAKNTDSSDGTYFVIVKAKGYDGKLYEKQGYVLLAR